MNPLTGNILWQRNMQKEEVKKIIQYFLEKNIYFAVEGKDCIYTPDGKRLKLHAPTTPFKTINDLSDYSIAKIIIPASIMKFSEIQINTLIDILQKTYKDIHVIKIKVTDWYGLDITSSESTKHIATLELMKMLGLEKEEVVGAGDGYNDYPLLTACGIKVAMGDAPEELKAIADFIAPPQKENGLLSVIDRYFPRVRI